MIQSGRVYTTTVRRPSLKVSMRRMANEICTETFENDSQSLDALLFDWLMGRPSCRFVFPPPTDVTREHRSEGLELFDMCCCLLPVCYWKYIKDTNHCKRKSQQWLCRVSQCGDSLVVVVVAFYWIMHQTNGTVQRKERKKIGTMHFL